MEIPATKSDGTSGSFLHNLNPNSLAVISNALGEPCLAAAVPGDRFQFERLGYFVKDSCPIRDSGDAAVAAGIPCETKPVFNKTIGLRDTWAKMQGQRTGKQE
jgi:glutaminyl-tRNA synthetase